MKTWGTSNFAYKIGGKVEKALKKEELKLKNSGRARPDFRVHIILITNSVIHKLAPPNSIQENVSLSLFLEHTMALIPPEDTKVAAASLDCLTAPSKLEGKQLKT